MANLRHSWDTRGVKKGSGGFVHSCLGHQDAIGMTGGDWQRIEINGTSMQQAVTDWWDQTEGQEGQWLLPCEVTTAPPHQCNPSCSARDPFLYSEHA